MKQLALLWLVLLATTARADNKLGFRFGGSRLPLAEDPHNLMQIGIGVEHALAGKMRIFAEYEWLWITMTEPAPMGEPDAPVGIGHRTHLGLRRTFAEKGLEQFSFYADIESGIGLGMYDVQSGVEVVPHAFVGLRGGYRIGEYSPRAAKELETEIHFRAIVVEYGVGFGGGLGFYWRD